MTELLSQTWPVESLTGSIHDLRSAIRRGKGHAKRANFRAARREAIEWRARILRGERVPPPQPRKQPSYKPGGAR